MEHLPDLLQNWLMQYGSFALFLLLSLGIFALPVPDETLMIVSGILIDQGKMHVITTILAAYSGAIFGITVSYVLGYTLGFHFIRKYGYKISLTEAKLQKAHYWFETYGKWTLFVGYFIPGIRHFTGFSAGASRLKYHEFALFAYSGAILWSSIFLSVGYFFGEYWESFFKFVEEYFDIRITLVVLVLLLILAYALYTKFKRKQGS